MNNESDYLEKYSVAPSPNRDYYGIKILNDKIILLLWKISHGPHRAPVIRVSTFFEFASDKTLQDEIQRIFGNYLLEHVKNISKRKLSLLTLQKNIIAKIIKYLRIRDILNLATLSRASKEVFDNNVVWEVMYREFKGSKISERDEKFAQASSWKQLLKEKKLGESIKTQKFCANGANAINSENPQKNSNSLKKSPINLKGFSKARNLENVSLKLEAEAKQTHVRKISTTASENKLIIRNQIGFRGKELKSSQITVNKNINQQLNLAMKPKSNLSVKSTENVISKNNSSDLLNRKLKPKQNVKNKALIPNLKVRGKSEFGKQEKIRELNEFASGESIFDNVGISLIEENLKKMKSEKSIFNYDFSVLDNKKASGDSKITF